MKLGLDLHGCADTHYKIYGPLTRMLTEHLSHEVHIITGRQPTNAIINDLQKKGICWNHWFSIAQHHIDLGEEKVWFEDGKPWMETDVWNRTKAEYCEQVGIDIHIDDSPIYGSYFTGNTLYLLQRDQAMQAAWIALAGRL